MLFLMFNCVFLSVMMYVLLPSGAINHVLLPPLRRLCIRWD